MKRMHGKAWQSRWNRCGIPPVHTLPPLRGMPALERTHPYHYKMSAGTILGPRCNHDLGIVAKLPVLDDIGCDVASSLAAEVECTESSAAEFPELFSDGSAATASLLLCNALTQTYM